MGKFIQICDKNRLGNKKKGGLKRRKISEMFPSVKTGPTSTHILLTNYNKLLLDFFIWTLFYHVPLSFVFFSFSSFSPSLSISITCLRIFLQNSYTHDTWMYFLFIYRNYYIDINTKPIQTKSGLFQYKKKL